MSNQPPTEPEKPSIWLIIGSVLAALFGVQSEQQRQRDFRAPSILPYIIVGIVMVAAMVLGLWGLVKLILSQL
jgi:uncharacterized membrane protein YidH (DUF202 family)